MTLHQSWQECEVDKQVLWADFLVCMVLLWHVAMKLAADLELVMQHQHVITASH